MCQLMSGHISLPLVELNMKVLKTIIKQMSTGKYNTPKFTIILHAWPKLINNLI